MEKHISKKLFAAVCALSGAFILASCDPVTAVPTNYNSAIVKNNDGSEVKADENKLGKIYDAIASDRNTKIVSDILDEVATKKFGEYYDIKKAALGSDDDVKNYIEAHKDVFKREGDDEGAATHRFEQFIEDIGNRISEVFYNEITSGSYNDEEGRFDEGKLWIAHFYEFYDLGNQAGAEANSFFVTNELTKENALDSLEGVYDVYDLRAEWEAKDEQYKKEHPFNARGYIEEKIFPQILKDKLVEEYVYNTNYSSLGRSYARNINYIKVSYESDIIPRRLLRKFADEFIAKETNGNTPIDFEIIAQALKGFDSIGDFKENTGDGVIALSAGDAAYDLLDAVITDADKLITIPSEHASYYKLGTVELLDTTASYFKETKIGELIESYEKAIKAVEAGRFPTSVDKAELDKFLASGKSMAYGLREKLLSLAKEDYTTDGWFIKNGGLSELPSALRDRLFNINVANTLDDGSLWRETREDDTMGKYEYSKTTGTALKRLPYLRNVYGHKFVIPAKSLPYAEDAYNYIYQDVEGKAFYIVQVLEAPSTPKLNLKSETSYSKLVETKDIPYKTEDIARQVAKVLGTKDSYIKDAYTEILKKYSFVFYETSLYEHFKSEYPDLFDEE